MYINEKYRCGVDFAEYVKRNDYCAWIVKVTKSIFESMLLRSEMGQNGFFCNGAFRGEIYCYDDVKNTMDNTEEFYVMQHDDRMSSDYDPKDIYTGYIVSGDLIYCVSLMKTEGFIEALKANKIPI